MTVGPDYSLGTQYDAKLKSIQILKAKSQILRNHLITIKVTLF